MKLTIDNLDGRGPRDYSAAIDSLRKPQVIRRLNKPAELRISLVASSPDFVVPTSGARVTLGRTNGRDIFTGYLAKPAQYEYLGWSEHGPTFRYNLVAQSDEFLLDRKTIPTRFPFVARSAGDALRLLTEEMLPGVFDTSAAEGADTVPYFPCDRQKSWSEHAAGLAQQARASYRIMDAALVFAPLGQTAHVLDESADYFVPEGLTLQPVNGVINDVTVIGRIEPSAYVKDYFVGDGLSLKFYLSQRPFTRSSQTLIDEEYTSLDPMRWVLQDPARVISISSGKLQVAGGTAIDGQTTLQFIERIELGGALILQHGDVVFNGASDGVLGGLYPSATSAAGCVAGFRISPFGNGSRIQALVNGALSGAALTTQPGHRYVFTTRIYVSEIYRKQQTFHSSTHPAGAGRGGSTVPADVRAVLEIHDIDPANPGSLAAPSTVLYDGVLTGAPDFANYVLVNAINLRCSIAFTRILRAVDAEVRSAVPGADYRTRLAGSLVDGAECRISTEPALQFFPQHVPAQNEQIVVRYRGSSRALTRVTNSSSIAATRNGSDDGVRGVVHNVKAPAPRTTAECENAALALLDDSRNSAWAGEYQTWSDFLPSLAADVFPGDALQVRAPSRGASFDAIVREVDIEVADLAGEHCRYKIRFADDRAEPMAFEFESGHVKGLPATLSIIDASQVGMSVLPDLTAAEITQVTSTSVSIDAGVAPPLGGGIEVRYSDFGWGQGNDRNLMGRFNTRNFTVPRLARVQDYFVRQYDTSSPAKYSRYSAALHIDYPL